MRCFLVELEWATPRLKKRSHHSIEETISKSWFSEGVTAYKRLYTRWDKRTAKGWDLVIVFEVLPQRLHKMVLRANTAPANAKIIWKPALCFSLRLLLLLLLPFPFCVSLSCHLFPFFSFLCFLSSFRFQLTQSPMLSVESTVNVLSESSNFSMSNDEAL